MHPRQATRLLVGSSIGLSLIGLVYIASAASYWSLLAIGPAGWMGGFSESRQKLLYLPKPQDDFIFALIVETSHRKGGRRMEKLIDIEERIPSLRRKRKRRMTLTFSILLFLFFLALFLILYLQSSWSKVQSIVVDGTVIVSSEDILARSGLSEGDSMWGFRTGEIVEKVQAHPAISEVSVTRSDFTTVRIEVDEYEVVGFRSNNEKQLVLANGEVVESSVAGSLYGPALIDFQNDKAENRLITELAKLEVTERALLSEVMSTPSTADPYLVTIYMNDGNTVIASAVQLAENIGHYPAILQQIPDDQKGIVDMEVGIFFKSYDATYSSEEGEEIQIEEE